MLRMKPTVLKSVLRLLGTLCLLAGAQRVAAVPVFARKFHTSCMTCHEMMPRLNAFGEAFRLNGFRWPEGTQPAQQEEPVSLGSEGYKKTFPDSVWPSDIPGSVPVAARLMYMFKDTSSGDRETEWEWELQTAGTIGDKISFFGHANFVQNSAADPTTKNKAVWAGFVNFQDLFGTQHILNLQLGIVGFEESDFFHYRNHSTDSLLPASARTFGSIDTIPYPTGFDKPDLFKLKRGPGAMLWGATSNSAYSLGYRMGDQDGGTSDMDVVFGQWAYKIGGMNKFGQTKQQFQEGYMENSLAFGMMGDIGSVPIRATPTALRVRDKFWRAGADMRMKVGSWTGRAGTITGRNSNPYATLNQGSLRYNTWFVETDYHVLPWLLPELRYETNTFRLPDGMNLGQPNRARLVPTVSALYGANVRFTFWGELYSKERKSLAGTKLDSSLVGFQLDMAF